jgi:hypothetical protein
MNKFTCKHTKQNNSQGNCKAHDISEILKFQKIFGRSLLATLKDDVLKGVFNQSLKTHKL